MRRLVQWASARARAKRGRALLSLIESIHRRQGSCRIIDLGGEPGYWQAIGLDKLARLGAEITIVNSEQFQAISIDEGLELKIRYIKADACDLAMLADQSFDLAHSNSTIEHVGEWERMKAFAAQLRRLAPSYYVQTPYMWFPIEPHFLTLGFHWLPESVRAQRLMKRRHGHHDRQPTIDSAIEVVRSARLLDRRQFEGLFPDARMDVERLGGLIKSLIGVRELRKPSVSAP